MDLKLAGKVVLITGSSRGIGLATAKAFAGEGCLLMLSARSPKELAEAEAALRASGVAVAAQAADVSKPREAAELIHAAIAAYGGIDVLVNNVGGGGGGSRIADSTDDDWRSLRAQPDPDGADDAAGAPAYEGPCGRFGHQCGIDFRLVAAARNVRTVRRGQGSADFRYRALGARICAIRHSREHGIARINSGSRQWLGSLPPHQPGISSMIMSGTVSQWAVSAPSRRSPTSSFSWHRHAPIGSTAGTYRSMDWNNRTRPSIAGHSKSCE